MRCFALINAAVAPRSASAMAASPAVTPTGLGPAQLQSAYNLTSAAASAGAGKTVYIVDAYDYPTAQADLDTYRAQYGLPACDAGCFTKINQDGATSPLPPAAGASGWDEEESLDIDMVSAICPLCHITLVEADDPTDDDMYTAQNTAASLGKFVSDSWGRGEYPGEVADADTYFNHPGVAITVAAGDDPGPSFPAEARFVTAVGGTTLSSSAGSRGWTETPWAFSGGGCSAMESAPTWQASQVTGCGDREDNDVSADADPDTGAATYNSYSQGGWLQVGGTSESAPIIAAVYALAGTPASDTYPSRYPWAHEPGGLYPVGSGYSSVPGWGTPDGAAAFAPDGGGNTVTVTSPGSQSAAIGTAVSLQVHASDSAPGQTLDYTASGLPLGLSISSSGLISGTPTTTGTSSVSVTATDPTGGHGSVSFTWTVTSGGSGGGCAAGQLLGNPGFETGTPAPWTMTPKVLSDDSGESPHSGSWYVWMHGRRSAYIHAASQPVTLPPGCGAYTFSFYLHIDTQEGTPTLAYDTLQVQVTDGSGTVLGTLATFSNLDAAGGYFLHSYSLAGYAGQTITLKFTGSEDDYLPTSFVIDDTAVVAG